MIQTYIGILDIPFFISLSGIFCINGLTLILTIIGQFDVKHIIMLQIKNNNVSYIIIRIKDSPVGLVAIDTRNNVCFDLQNGRYSIDIVTL